MTALIIIAIYLVGCVVAYLIFKYTENQTKGSWELVKPTEYYVRDRVSNLKSAIFSWLVLAVWVIVIIVELIPKPTPGWWQNYLNKPAKW